jgi:hypothetical protein
MYTLTFINFYDERLVQTFDDSSDAVNAAVQMQVQEGGYNNRSDWYYDVKDANGNVVYRDECMRYFG